MGYYLNPKEAQHTFDKVRTLVVHHGAKIIAEPEKFSDVPEGKALICVVDAGAWEAAALAYNEAEFECFRNPSDDRDKVWLIMDKEIAHQMAGYD